MQQSGEYDFYRSILEGLHVAVYVVNRDGKILFWNDGAERITGYLRQDVIGHMHNDNLLGATDSDDNELTGHLSPAVVAMREGQATPTHRVSLRHKSGHRILVQLWAFPVRDADGAIVGAAETFEENVAVGDWDRRQTRLATYGCIDAASGVLTHRMVHSYMREGLGVFAEHHVPLSILCIQIDRLEEVQARDGLGAIATVLRIVGQTLENSLRPTDHLGRWQENQFLAVLTECRGAEIMRTAERLRRMVAGSKIAWWGERLPVTISLGGTAARSGDTVDAMALRAELALAESTQRDGNLTTVRIADPAEILRTIPSCS